MKADTKNLIVCALIIAGIIFLVLGLWVFRSHMESATYNKLTGAKTTTWDAMWVELRVIGEPTR